MFHFCNWSETHRFKYFTIAGISPLISYLCVWSASLHLFVSFSCFLLAMEVKTKETPGWHCSRFSYPSNSFYNQVPKTVWCSNVFWIVALICGWYAAWTAVKSHSPSNVWSVSLPSPSCYPHSPQPSAVQGSNDAAQTRTRYPGVH